jgi:hypothetical protein
VAPRLSLILLPNGLRERRRRLQDVGKLECGTSRGGVGGSPDTRTRLRGLVGPGGLYSRRQRCVRLRTLRSRFSSSTTPEDRP